jgi:hypothetical protein
LISDNTEFSEFAVDMQAVETVIAIDGRVEVDVVSSE